MIPLKIYGLIGYPVKHSLSPKMHNAAFCSLNINAEYRLFEVPPERLEEFLLDPNAKFEDIEGNSFPAGDVLGFNITIPHKVPALIKNITIVTSLEVVLSGAVNTVKRDNGKLHYRNTDGVGFVKSLREDLKFYTSDKNILIFGCGGAGRAVIAGLTCEGANVQKIYIYDTNKEAVESAKKHFSQFQDVINKLKFISSEQIPNSINECQLLVNASPVGMKDDDGSVIDKSLLHKDLYVYDVVYNRETQLIKDAKSLGLHFKDGLGMLLHQGAAAFEFWTGQEAPIEIMRKALEEELAILKRIGLPESYRGRA